MPTYMTPSRIARNPYLRPARLVRVAGRASPARWRGRGRVQTRVPLRQAQGSRFKTYSTVNRVCGFTNDNYTTGVWSADDNGQVSNNLICAYIAPAIGNDDDRKIVGNKAKFVAVNIFGRFTNRTTNATRMRITAVECISTGAEFVNATTAINPEDQWLTKYFKSVNYDEPQGTYLPWTGNIPLKSRWFVPRNIADYRILSEKWITFNPLKKVEGSFHMYIPVNKLIDKDKTISTNNCWAAYDTTTNKTTPARTAEIRYSTVHPIVLLIEVIPTEGVSWNTTQKASELIRGTLNFKYTMFDAL